MTLKPKFGARRAELDPIEAMAKAVRADSRRRNRGLPRHLHRPTSLSKIRKRLRRHFRRLKALSA